MMMKKSQFLQYYYYFYYYINEMQTLQQNTYGQVRYYCCSTDF